MIKGKLFFVGLLGSFLQMLQAQTFYFGNDLSYVNQMEDCGAVYKEKMQPKDPFKIFADHGTNLVRVRLWNNPYWQNSLQQPAGVKSQYNDFDDVKKTIRRAKANGMYVMLDIHFSDFWADPKAQIVPKSWLPVAYNDNFLADSVYNFVKFLLNTLNSDSLMPEIVKVGNEANPGMMIHTTLTEKYEASGLINYSWTRQAKLFNAAFKAIRDVSLHTVIKPKICLHYAGLKNVADWYQNLINYGITDFDIIGFSYYYAWHGHSIASLGTTIKNLKAKFPQYQVMVVETGYPWSTQNFDAMPNIVTTPDPLYLPVCPEKQLEYMIDYTRMVMKSGGIGVIFWEPAWVSTPCRIPWGIGSSHDHLAFFDPIHTNFMENGAGRWTEPHFYENIDSTYKVVFKVDISSLGNNKKAFIRASFLPENMTVAPMVHLGNQIYSYTAYLKTNDSIHYQFLSDSLLSYAEEIPLNCKDPITNQRLYIVQAKDTIIGYYINSCNILTNIKKVKVTLRVDMNGYNTSRGVYVTGTLNNWSFTQLIHEKNNIYSVSFTLNANEIIHFYFIRNNSWTNYQDYREKIPATCALAYGSDRLLIVPQNDTILNLVFNSCDTLKTKLKQKKLSQVEVYPNPSSNDLFFRVDEPLSVKKIEIYNPLGLKVKEFFKPVNKISLIDLPVQTYFLKIYFNNKEMKQVFVSKI